MSHSAGLRICHQASDGVRTSRAVMVAVLAVLLGGCAGSKPPIRAWQEEIANCDREVRDLSPEGAPESVLRVAEAGSSAADSVIGAGESGKAVPHLRTALADIRAALALAEMASAEARANECAEFAKSARDRWDAARNTLNKAEDMSRQSAMGVPSSVPALPARSELPTSTIPDDGTPPTTDERIHDAWENWSSAARDRHVPTADLTTRFRAACPTERPEKKEQPLLRHEAGRIVQELEARVRRAGAEALCRSVEEVTDAIGDAMHRSLQAAVALYSDQLAKLREQATEGQRAQTRQDQLNEYLRELPGLGVGTCREADRTIVSLPDSLFDARKASLREAGKIRLTGIATVLGHFTDMKIRVEAHTDSTGNSEYNLKLSQQRARAVSDFFSSRRIAAERISAEGFGATRPAAGNATPEGRQRNRRIDIVIEDAH